MNGSNNPIQSLTMYLSLSMALYFVYKTFPLIAFLFGFLALCFLLYKFVKSITFFSSVATKSKIKEVSNLNIVQYIPWLKENIRGHDEVIDQVVNQIQQNVALANEKRTLGAYFLVGPTGTGKTFLAELTAQALFPDSKPLVLRMNQYKHSSDVLTLLGPPLGHVGVDLGGALTRPVLENPCRVIILDEIDKCHSDVLDCLYNILDVAHCTEKSSGKIVDFTRCVFFATTNAGVEQLRELDTKDKDKSYIHSRYRSVLSENSSMDKAFLARWDGVFFMDSLNSLSVAQVACLQICKYWRQFDMEVVYASPELLVKTVQSNFEFKEFGVRQLSNHIKMTTDPIIASAKQKGIKRVCIDIDSKTKAIVVKAAS